MDPPLFGLDIIAGNICTVRPVQEDACITLYSESVAKDPGVGLFVRNRTEQIQTVVSAKEPVILVKVSTTC